MYLCLSLTFLPDDDSRCSHGSTLPDGADQVGLRKTQITLKYFCVLASVGLKLSTNVLIM